MQHGIDRRRAIGGVEAGKLLCQFLGAPSPDVGDRDAIAACEGGVDVSVDRLGMLIRRPGGMADGAGVDRDPFELRETVRFPKIWLK